MGYALRIPNVKFGIDNSDILTNGSLILIEPGSQENPWVGVPANGSSVPNLAGSQATSLIGSNVQNITFERTMLPAEGIVERSGRGGLHVAENWGSGVSNHVVAINMLSAMRNYLDANQGHNMYLATWGRFTRAPDPSLPQVLHSSVTGATGTRLGVGQLPSSGALTGAPGSTDARRLGFHVDNSQGLAYEAIAAQGVPSSGWSTPHAAPVLRLGPVGSAQVGKSAGYLLWWMYLEDLTVSGRTFAQVDALVYSYYQQQVLSQTGKYYGDTYTSP